MSEKISYKSSGVDIDVADSTKREMATSLETTDTRVLNRIGAFASLFAAEFPGIIDPVLVMKMEEPGSKQKLALEAGQTRSICFDLVNHLINDIAVMGAEPLAVQDCIVCGKLEPEVVKALVCGMADACRVQGCTLVGGETSEQPGVLAAGTYILSASVVGVVDRSKLVDGSRVREGDVVLAVASNGLHTNGYSLVRKLLEAKPALRAKELAGRSFFEALMEPHLCYLQGIRGLRGNPALHALAHITGGGIGGNLNRVMPEELSAVIDLTRIEVPALFSLIAKEAAVPESDLLRTFNCGVGLTIVCAKDACSSMIAHFSAAGYRAYEIGFVEQGVAPVRFFNSLRLDA